MRAQAPVCMPLAWALKLFVCAFNVNCKERMRLLFLDVQLIGFPTSAPACMWLYWCSWYCYWYMYCWYRYFLLWLYGISIWALRLTPPGVFRLRCRSGPAKQPAGLPSSPLTLAGRYRYR